jgi:hypothetical protein
MDSNVPCAVLRPMSNDRRAAWSPFHRDALFETIGAPASGDFGGRSCGGWPKVADYAFGSNPPYELKEPAN